MSSTTGGSNFVCFLRALVYDFVVGARNATDQSGLIPAEGMAFVIKKPSNHSYKYLIATIRPTTWVVGAVIFKTALVGCIAR
jgi:hypothetical protein